MSAAIHPFPGRDPHHAPRLGDDDLLAELASAVAAPGREPSPAPATVTRLPVRHRDGANDLVVTGSGRDRVVVTVLVTVLLALAFAVLAGWGGADADGDPAVAAVVTLEDGQTLWGIAEDATPADGDVRATVAAIMDLNDFPSPTLPVGTPIRLPEVAG